MASFRPMLGLPPSLPPLPASPSRRPWPLRTPSSHTRLTVSALALPVAGLMIAIGICAEVAAARNFAGDAPTVALSAPTSAPPSSTTTEPALPGPTSTEPTPSTTTIADPPPQPPTTTAASLPPVTAPATTAPVAHLAAHQPPPGTGCGPALAYLTQQAAPGFQFVCPGYADGAQALTCLGQAPCAPNQRMIVIADPCPAAYRNEAHNSWVLLHEAFGTPVPAGDMTIDPFGHC